jgi:hypothetical protein
MVGAGPLPRARWSKAPAFTCTVRSDASMDCSALVIRVTFVMWSPTLHFRLRGVKVGYSFGFLRHGRRENGMRLQYRNVPVRMPKSVQYRTGRTPHGF